MKYSGIDLHSNNSVVTVTDEEDRVRKMGKMGMGKMGTGWEKWGHGKMGMEKWGG